MTKQMPLVSFKHTSSNSRLRSAAAALLAVALLSATGLTASEGSGSQKLDAALQRELNSAATRPVRILVGVKPGALEAVRREVEQLGGRTLAFYRSIDAVLVAIDRLQVARLASRADIATISTDAVVQSPGRQQPTSGEWLETTLLPTLGLGATSLTGDGVGIAIIDSGVNPSGDLRKLTAVAFADGDPNPGDGFGHGTHVAGLVAGTGAMSAGLFRGVAPKARIISLKVLAADGTGLTSSVLLALDYAIEHRQRLGIDIINLSLGHPVFEPAATDPLVRAVEAASRAGIVVVVSAGNAGINRETGLPGYAGILSPGNAPSAITVGAVNTRNTTTRQDDVVPDYSSRGPTFFDTMAKPDLVAPGHNLVSATAFGSTLYNNYPERQVSVNGGVARYQRLSGTSMAAAVTSGVVALMLESGRTTFGVSPSPNAVKAMLQYSAVPLANANSLMQGAGALNGGGAIELARSLDPSVPAGSWWLVGGINPVTVIDGESLPWGQAILWGNTVVWGNSIFFNVPVWGNTVVWGNSDFDTVVWGNTDGDTIVWGNTDWETVVWGNSDLDTIVWGNTDLETVVWGNTIVWGNAIVIGNTVVWGNTIPRE